MLESLLITLLGFNAVATVRCHSEPQTINGYTISPVDSKIAFECGATDAEVVNDKKKKIVLPIFNWTLRSFDPIPELDTVFWIGDKNKLMATKISTSAHEVVESNLDWSQLGMFSADRISKRVAFKRNGKLSIYDIRNKKVREIQLREKGQHLEMFRILGWSTDGSILWLLAEGPRTDGKNKFSRQEYVIAWNEKTTRAFVVRKHPNINDLRGGLLNVVLDPDQKLLTLMGNGMNNGILSGNSFCLYVLDLGTGTTIPVAFETEDFQHDFFKPRWEKNGLLSITAIKYSTKLDIPKLFKNGADSSIVEKCNRAK